MAVSSAEPVVRPPSAPSAAGRPQRRPVSIRMLAIGFGVLATLVSFAGSWIPSFWGDEAASVMSAERPLPSLFSMLGRVDAVHGSYYLLLHLWIDLFGSSPLSVRLPSALAVGIASTGSVLLAEQLFVRRVAVMTGLMCVVLPRFTFMGTEARSYAIATAAAVWLTVLLVRLLKTRSRSRAGWFGYALGLALGIYVFLYLGLMVLVHGIVILSDRHTRAVLRVWLTAVGLGLLLAAPVIIAGVIERSQIDFLARSSRLDLGAILADQWFGNPWLAGLCWALIVLGGAVGIGHWRQARVAEVSPAHDTSSMNGLTLAWAWLAVPTAVVLIASVAIQPMYTDRYLSFSTPAAAILVGVGVTALPATRLRLIAVIAILALAAPSYVAQRSEFGKPGGSDWAQVSEVIGRFAHPGDGIVFDETVKPSWRPRLAMHLYPDDYRGLDDIALTLPFRASPGLWDQVAPLSSVLPRLSGVTTVWALQTVLSNDADPDSNLPVLESNGFTVVRTVKLHRTIVYELARSQS